MSKKRSFRGAFFMLCKIVSKYPSVFSPKIKAPAESPTRRFPASFFYAGILPRVRVSPCDPHPLHARSARCNANPAESPMRRFLASFFYAGILPGYAYRPAIRTRCTLARLAVMRIRQSHQCIISFPSPCFYFIIMIKLKSTLLST